MGPWTVVQDSSFVGWAVVSRPLFSFNLLFYPAPPGWLFVNKQLNFPTQRAAEVALDKWWHARTNATGASWG